MTLVEVVLCILVVGVMLASSLTAVGASRSGQFRMQQKVRANLLAQDLMAEILQKNYKAPGSTLIGLGSGEVAGVKTTYNDVDDYDGYSESPPKYPDGTTMPNLTGWKRSVEVDWVNPANPDQIVATEKNVKRVVVTVSYNGVTYFKLTALRANLE
jgi:type II secretory pathway pseudopilin PulG